MVEEYSARQLTQPEDKVLAILGLQNKTAVLVSDEPFCGMWRGQHFWPSLMWTTAITESPPAGGVHIICPSWSWASTYMPVSYSVFDYPHVTFQPKIVSWNIITVKENIQVEGSITIRGKLLRPKDLLVQTSRNETIDPEDGYLRQPSAHWDDSTRRWDNHEGRRTQTRPWRRGKTSEIELTKTSHSRMKTRTSGTFCSPQSHLRGNKPK